VLSYWEKRRQPLWDVSPLPAGLWRELRSYRAVRAALQFNIATEGGQQ
jgi:hypothetical protein